MLPRLSRIVLLLLLAPLAGIAACQGPDVGQPCTLSWGQNVAIPPPTSSGLYALGGADYVEFNAASGCEGLVCIVSPAAPDTTYASGDYSGPGAGYCSKSCVSDRDCYNSETELVCRTMVLDQQFIESLDPATRERYLGGIKDLSYCGVAR